MLLGYVVYRVGKSSEVNIFVNIFLVHFPLVDFFTYVITAIESAPLQRGHPIETFFAYAVTHIPLAIVEGLHRARVQIVQSRGHILVKLKVLTP